MQNNIKKDYFWNTLGVFAQNAISPLLLIVITRINGIYDSGIFSLAFSISIVFWAIGLWGGRTYQVSDVKKEFAQRSYVMVRLVLAVVMLVGACVFAYMSGYDLGKTEIIVALVIFKVIESIADVIYGILQVHRRLYKSGISLLYKALLGISAFVVIDLITNSILLSSIGVVLVNLAILFVYDIRFAKKFEDLSISKDQFARYIKEAIVIMRRCFYVFAVSFLAMLSINVPRYFIDSYHPNETGYFGIIVMPVTLIALVISFILQPNVVGLADLYNDKKYKEFNHVVNKLLLATGLVGAFVLAVTILIGAQLLELAFGVSFEAYKLALAVVVLGGIANSLVFILINILTIIRRIKIQMYVLLITNIALVGASMYVTRDYGLMGGIGLFAGVNSIQFILLFLTYKVSLKRSADVEKN